MGAITWLKNNNSQYQIIKLNSNWFNSTESRKLSTLLNGVTENDHISQKPCNDNADRIAQDTLVAEMDNCNGSDDITQKGCVNSIYNEPSNVNQGGDNCHESGKEQDDKIDSMNSLTTAAEDSDQVMKTGDKCSDDDSELDEDQTALQHRQQLTGDALPTVVQKDNLENQMYGCAPSENEFPNLSYWMKTLRFLPFMIYSQMALEHTIHQMGQNT